MAVDLTQYVGKYPQAVLDAIQKLFDTKPDQAAAFQDQYGGNLETWLHAFEGFWTDPKNTTNVDPTKFDLETALMGALGYTVNPNATGGAPALTTGPGGTPIEQGLLQTVLPGLLANAAADPGRQATVTALTNQANAGYSNLANVLSQAAAHFDGQAYFQQNPNVAGLYNQSNNGSAPGTKSIQTIDGKVVDMTPDQFAEYYHTNWGASQGLTPTYTSTVAQQQQGNAATAAAAVTSAAQQAAASQLAALQTSIAQSTQNLQGNLAARASALQAAVASLNQNLSTLDATQRANLATQIQTMQQDLQTAIDAQRQALTTEVQQLQGNSDAAAQQRRAALTAEIDQLTAAQAPLNQARLQGAEALSTAVNLGLTATQQEILARQAAGGFVGGSTMTDAALARASIDARQQAAGAVAGANIANAADNRDIGVRGATQGYSIADALAGERLSAANLGATGGAALTGALAQGRLQIGNAGSAGLRTIADATATSRAQIGNSATNQTYADTVAGANSLQALQDRLASGGYNLAAALAQQTQQAKNSQAAANFAIGQNLFPSAVTSAQALALLPGQQAQSLTSIVPYGNAGLTATQNALNWWASPNTPAPTPTATTQPPGTTGNAISSLGSGLLGAAFSVGNANNWWAPKPTTTTNNTVGGQPTPPPGTSNGD